MSGHPTGRNCILTDQQRDILVLKANGYTARRAAEKLGIGQRAVDTAMVTIFDKLGVTNCPQAVAIAIKTNEITMDRIEMTLLDKEDRHP